MARARAHHDVPEVLLEDLCFDAQQTAEKALKAILVDRQIEFPKTHDVMKLLTLVASTGVDVPEKAREAARLTRYGTAGRYPGHWEDVTEAEYVEAVRLAQFVLSWAESVITVR